MRIGAGLTVGEQSGHLGKNRHGSFRTGSVLPTGHCRPTIRELANRYPYLIPTCDGEGYADMYADDGVFIDRWSNVGLKEGGIRWQGRDKLTLLLPLSIRR